jgi:anti-sigma factor RsiW
MNRENSNRGTPQAEESLPKFEKVRGRDGNWYLACGEVITFLFEYLEDGVPPERRAEFERHLAICPSCRNYLDTYRETLLLAYRAELADEIDIPEVPQHLLDAIIRSRG